MTTCRQQRFTAQDLLTLDFPDIVWAVEQLIPSGLTLLVGRPKSGKSWLALPMGLAVASGEPYLPAYTDEEGAMDGFPTVQGGALYLALEDTPQRLKTRIQFLGHSGETVSPHCEFVLEWPSGDEGIAALHDWMTDHPQTKLIIVDTLQHFRGVSNVRDKNVYAEDYTMLGKLKSVADTYNVAVVVVHHTRKGPKQEDLIDKVLGTSGISGAADTIIGLNRTSNKYGELEIVGRDTGRQTYLLEFIAGIGWTCRHALVEDEQADKTAVSAKRQELLAYLEAATEPVSPAEVTCALCWTQNTTRAWLSRLVREGRAHRVGRGRYVAALAAPEDADDTAENDAPVEDEMVIPY